MSFSSFSNKNKNSTFSPSDNTFPPLPPIPFHGVAPRPRPGSIPINNQFNVLGQIPPKSGPCVPPLPNLNTTFSQKLQSSPTASSATPLPNTPLIPKSYIRHESYVEDPYHTIPDPYQTTSQILPPRWNYVPRNPMFTQEFYQHILQYTKSVEFEKTQCKYDPSNIGFSKFTIQRIISSKEWGQPWTLQALSEPFRQLKNITYYDYVDAWTFALFFENKTHRHTWFIRFKGFQCLEPIPHWFIQWWDRFGADEKLLPPRLKKAYDQWSLDPHDTLTLEKYPSMKNPSCKNIPILLRFFI